MVDEFGHRLWDIEKRNIIRSRDVVFQEDQLFGDVEKNDNSKEIVDGVVDLTHIPSLVQTTGGEGKHDDSDCNETHGLPSEAEEQCPQLETIEPQVNRST